MLIFVSTDRQTDKPIALPLLRMHTRGNNHVVVAVLQCIVIKYRAPIEVIGKRAPLADLVLEYSNALTIGGANISLY
jgi:hypothetical protein